jgi:hypothetical protein
MKQLEGEKVIMEELLQLIPELDDLFFLLEGKRTFIKVGNVNQQFVVPGTVLDHFHMTENRFKEFLASKFERGVEFSNDSLAFSLNTTSLFGNSPLKFNIENKHFALPLNKENYFNFPELLVHYLLLYNLSMIARYETEWWSELTKMMPNQDYPFICSFLDVTMQKGPFLVYQYLM